VKIILGFPKVTWVSFSVLLNYNPLSDFGDWKLEALWFLPNLLGSSTCLHALLLTSLRLLSLERLIFYSSPNLFN
jgi:hypothetical protein